MLLLLRRLGGLSTHTQAKRQQSKPKNERNELARAQPESQAGGGGGREERALGEGTQVSAVAVLDAVAVAALMGECQQHTLRTRSLLLLLMLLLLLRLKATRRHPGLADLCIAAGV